LVKTGEPKNESNLRQWPGNFGSLASGRDDLPLERYKSNRGAAAIIAKALGFPDEAGTDDDHLDAYVAFILGKMLLRSEARWVGSAKTGG